MKKVTSFLTAFSLSLGLLTLITPLASATSIDSCDGSYSSGGIRATATHSTIFYIDSGQGQNVDASYVGYQINSTTNQSNVWAKVDSFSGGVVSLANPADAEFSLGSISSETKTAFFLLKAPSSTSTSQSHVLHVYDGKPGLTTSTELYSCKFTFTKVAETIKALANKVNSVSSSATSLNLGETFTITETGATGTIGQGNATDGDMIWFSPTARSSWPSTSLRLISTTALFYDKQTMNAGDLIATKNDVLRVKNLKTIGGGSNSKLWYKVIYYFKVLGPITSNVDIKPVAQISSGTQVKHNDLSGSALATLSSTLTFRVSATLAKSVSSTVSYSSGKTQLNYTLTLNNTGTSAVTFDQVVDSPPTSLTYVANSVRLSGAATAEPSFNSSNQLVFSQPVTVNAGTSKTITYSMIEKVACTTSAGISFQNSAVAYVGSTVIGSGASTYSLTTASGVCGNTTLDTATTTNAVLPVEVVTNPATSVANTSATINGTVDPNSNSGQTIYFEWGTSSTLSTFTSVNVGTTTSGNSPYALTSSLTGLSEGTMYYFRIRVGSVYGQILSFVTTQPVSTPVATTDPASNVSTTDATLNGTIDPNLTPVTVEMLVWKTGTDTVTVLLTDDPSQPYNGNSAQTTYNPYLQLGGAFPTQFSINMTDPNYGLSGFIGSGNTIYYRVRAKLVTGGTYVYAPEIRQFTMTTYNPQVITFAPISDINYGDLAPLIAPTSDSGMTIAYGSTTPDVCTVSASGVITILKAGTCTITADQAGGLKGGTSTYYEPAIQKVQSFVISPAAITITAAGKSKSYGDSDPVLTYTITAGALIGSDTFTGTLSRASGESVGTYLISQNTVTPGNNYSVTYQSANLTINQKVVTVTATPKSKQFGANDPTLTYTSTPALKAGDTFTGTLSRSSGENVGDYPILVGSLALPSGYQLIFVGDTLTVTAKPLTITADNKSKNAGDPTPTFTFQHGALVSPNDISSVTYNFSSGSYADSTTAPSADGSYTITPSAAVFSNGSASNYNITYATGTYTITSLQSQVLTWTTIGNKTYGNTPTGTVTSNRGLTPVTIVSNTTSICTVPSSSVSGASITLLSVGICELKASQAGNGTYGPATDVIESFTVLAAPLVITASSPTGVTAGDPVPTITPSYSGFVNSETSSVLSVLPTCITSYTTSSSAGATESTSCSGASATNYTISYVAGSFTVAAANNGNNGNNNNGNNNSTPAPVVKQKTTINWKNPNPIFVGTPLGGAELNAIYSVPGTCVYTPALGTLLPEGTHTLSVTCTPTDGVNYEPLTTTVTIQVKPAKKKATILWFNPLPIFNPKPLGADELNAKGSVPGSLEYDPAPGTVLPPGSHVLNVKLKPTDPNIDEVETKVTILVKTKPVDPKNPTPATPGNSNNPATPEVKEPPAPSKPAKEAAPAAIPTAKNAPVLLTAGQVAEVITVTPNTAKTGIIVSAPDWSLAISSTTKFVEGNTADSTARVVIEKGNTVTTSGTGFKPFSQVDVFVYSTPTWLGAVMTDAFGNFTTTLPMPKALPEGDHTFQAEGVTPDNRERTAAVPITLVPAVATVQPGQLRFEVYFGMNSVVITKAEAAKIAKNVKAALAKADSNSKITVSVVGWVQPNPRPGDIKFLSTNRAKNVADLMRKLGLKGSYSLNFPGLEKDNIPSARHASVTISWSISKPASA
ncbi:MAG: MBG domain-containing protein [Candidatus Planktophila sp.]